MPVTGIRRRSPPRNAVMLWPVAFAARSQMAQSVTDRARMPMPAAWTALLAHSALWNRRSGSSNGSPT